MKQSVWQNSVQPRICGSPAKQTRSFRTAFVCSRSPRRAMRREACRAASGSLSHRDALSHLKKFLNVFKHHQPGNPTTQFLHQLQWKWQPPKAPPIMAWVLRDQCPCSDPGKEPLLSVASLLCSWQQRSSGNCNKPETQHRHCKENCLHSCKESCSKNCQDHWIRCCIAPTFKCLQTPSAAVVMLRCSPFKHPKWCLFPVEVWIPSRLLKFYGAQVRVRSWDWYLLEVEPSKPGRAFLRQKLIVAVADCHYVILHAVHFLYRRMYMSSALFILEVWWGCILEKSVGCYVCYFILNILF